MAYWLIDTPGIGSIIVLVVGLATFVAYVYMLRWIQTAPREPGQAEALAEDKGDTAPSAGGKDA
jgi:hypothetical protein